MAGKEFGSLTKEPPLATLDATIKAASPGMPYSNLLDYARSHSNAHRDAPGLINKRFLLISNGVVAFDHFLSLTSSYDISSPFIRKIMYFVWAYRDKRIRRFVCERVSDSRGHWRIPELVKKSNSTFFEEWLSEGAARKARSNFQFFLSEAGLFDLTSRSIHLELDDGWLGSAATVAAQHESNPTLREELLASPIGFLERRGWLGLINATAAEATRASPALAIDTSPVEDVRIASNPSIAKPGVEWNRKAPTASGKASATASIDLVSRERANKSHYDLEKMLSDLARSAKLTPKFNQNIDMYFAAGALTVLVEIKSCTDGNFHSQIRKGVSQLFEYRYLYQNVLGASVMMLLVVESAPPKGKEWLVDYAASLDITIAWKEAESASFVSTRKISPELAVVTGPKMILPTK